MQDELFYNASLENIILETIYLIRDKEIILVRAVEIDYQENKKFLRSLMIMIKNYLVTTNYADTQLLISEIRLFDKGNKQNKYLEILKKDGDFNLKLKINQKNNIYITKAESTAICTIFNESKIGLSLQRLVASELRFTPKQLINRLFKDGLLG